MCSRAWAKGRRRAGISIEEIFGLCALAQRRPDAVGVFGAVGRAYTRTDRSIPEQYDTPDNGARLETLRKVAQESNCTPNQVILAWLMQSDPPVLPLIAASTPAQMQEISRRWMSAERETDAAAQHSERLTFTSPPAPSPPCGEGEHQRSKSPLHAMERGFRGEVTRHKSAFVLNLHPYALQRMCKPYAPIRQAANSSTARDGFRSGQRKTPFRQTHRP